MSIISMFPANYAKINIKAYAATGNLPASANEGAVAVITTTTIGDAYASAEVPESPASGDVRILLGSDSLAPIALTRDITIYPRAVYQYSGTAWNLLESYVYTGGAWVEVTMDLYRDGTFFLADAISRTTYNGTTAYLYTAADTIVLESHKDSATTYLNTIFYQAIDLTGVSAIRLTYDFPINEGAAYLSIWSSPSSGQIATAASANAGTSLTLTLDVSSFTGEYYIALSVTSISDGTAKMYARRIELIAA